MEAEIVALETGDVVIETHWNGLLKTPARIIVGKAFRLPFDDKARGSMPYGSQGWLIVVRDGNGKPLAHKSQNPAAEAFYEKSEAKRLGQTPSLNDLASAVISRIEVKPSGQGRENRKVDVSVVVTTPGAAKVESYFDEGSLKQDFSLPSSGPHHIEVKVPFRSSLIVIRGANNEVLAYKAEDATAEARFQRLAKK